MKDGTLRDRAYSILKRKILTCVYPPGSFISEISLLDEIGASRTPIREAVTKLENENLVQIISKKGILVKPVTLNEVNDIYTTRRLVEPYIVRAPGYNVDKTLLREYRDEYDQIRNEQDFMKLIQFDDRFHHLLISGCRNKYLTQMLGLVYDQNTRIRILSGKLTRRLDDTYLEHMRILDCLLADDTEGAAGAIHEHLQNSEKAAFDCLYRNS